MSCESDCYDEPLPGDSIKALKRMRAWESDCYKGDTGKWIEKEDLSLVVQTWTVNTNTRLRILVGGEIRLYSCKTRVLALNWSLVNRD